ncbi:MAG TPA: macro domain-containing protein [Gemmatimonadota bacterium]|nr:macro domain-containing protein [Gemmatimonadota bacterium]
MSTDKTCFVIMPFNKKRDGAEVIDFDEEVYRTIIEPSVETLGIKCLRCDQIEEAGSIHRDMFRHILEDEVAVVDTTTLNANVFYELGVRHSLHSSVTVLIRRKGTETPFNIGGMRVIEYDTHDPANVEATRTKIAEFIRNGLQRDESDSPVYDNLPGLRVAHPGRRPPDGLVVPFRVEKAPDKQICLITGDLTKIRDIDIWVNSENTNMQMARFYDRSISSIIRYGGAKKNQLGYVAQDVIADELRAIMGQAQSVPPGAVLSTTAGDLSKSNGVRRIFHAAAVIGELGRGYQQISNVDLCITNALTLADSDSLQEERLESILFPIMGAGTGKGNAGDAAETLVEPALSYLETHPDSVIRRVYFVVTRERTLAVWRRALGELAPRLAAVDPAG